MKNLSLSQKIWSVVFILSLSLVVSFIVSYKGFNESKNSLDEVVNVFNKRQGHIVETRNFQRSMIIYELKTVVAQDKNSQEKYLNLYEESKKSLLLELEEYKKIASEKVQATIENYRENFSKFYAITDQIVHSRINGSSIEEISPLFMQAEKYNELLLKDINYLSEFARTNLTTKIDKTLEDINSSIYINILVTSVSIFMALLISFVVIRALKISIDRIIASLKDGSNQVSSASHQIAAASEQLSQASAEQASSLEETAASIEEMSSMVSRNTENAKGASLLTEKAKVASDKGQEVIKSMIGAINDIDKSNTNIMERVSESNSRMKEIVKVVEEIARKTEVINDIVNKTELLSFNASVEAARAGEHGKGFAVVAEEVGKLARMSGEAASEITDLLSSSIDKVNSVVEDTSKSVGKIIEEGKKTVEKGIEVANACDEVFKHIGADIVDIDGKSHEISKASIEQTTGINEINKAVAELNQATQQNTATSEECASAAEELSKQAESLNETVATLCSVINGQGKGMGTQVEAKVLSFNKKKKLESAQVKAFKKASGIPDYNDSGFEDV